ELQQGRRRRVDLPDDGRPAEVEFVVRVEAVDVVALPDAVRGFGAELEDVRAAVREGGVGGAGEAAEDLVGPGADQAVLSG
ncbi:MAG: hypothetical protein RIM80_15965, partial [Alphaproteobacteria bacterium]